MCLHGEDLMLYNVRLKYIGILLNPHFFKIIFIGETTATHFLLTLHTTGK